MDDIVATLESLLKDMTPEDKSELIRIAGPAIRQAWLPNPGPQTDAYLSLADLLLFGGAAGGGKSSLLMGTAYTQHQESVIFRRAYVDIRGLEKHLLEINKGNAGYNAADKVLKRPGGKYIEFGALEKPGAEMSQQGRRRDFMGFDEGAQISRDKLFFVLGWLGSTDPKQRCRAIIASNPPIAGEGDWLIEEFAPWLDPMYANIAKPGELRWAITVGETTLWVAGPGEYKQSAELFAPGEWHKGMDKYTALSRTFIPSLLDDNPFLARTNYRATIENMREPLRSQLLYGDFLAGREDHEWQVIPTAWVDAAQTRWREAPKKHRRMIALATDVALGGGDRISAAALHEDNYFDEIMEMATTTDDPWEIAAFIVKNRRDGADLSVDATGGWGSGVKSHLKRHHEIECYGIVFSEAANGKSKDAKHTFKNKRSQMYWQFYEALNPDSGEDVMLPPSARLKAQLTAPRYKIKGIDIVIEAKEEIRKRLGSSTDDADAVVMAWTRRKAFARRQQGEVPGLPLPKSPAVPLILNRPDAWMMR